MPSNNLINQFCGILDSLWYRKKWMHSKTNLNNIEQFYKLNLYFKYLMHRLHKWQNCSFSCFGARENIGMEPYDITKQLNSTRSLDILFLYTCVCCSFADYFMIVECIFHLISFSCRNVSNKGA